MSALSQTQHAAARQIFERILELSLPDAQIDDFVQEQSNGDVLVSREVMELLGIGREFTFETTSDPAPDPDTLIGTTVDEYTLTRVLGKGGMAVVYEARSASLKRRVALKIVALETADRAVADRFERERVTLASMRHINIAQIYDTGITEDGRPYIVMELVDGNSITDHCDQHSLTLDSRLKLFMKVCDGVAHAHRKLVVHRDLKPANVLIATSSGSSEPKIIDFGIAKVLKGELEDSPTLHGQLLGTPLYMSPEQISGSIGDIDVRTDVYALGLILYELIVGARPFSDPATPWRYTDSGGSETDATRPRRLVDRFSDADVDAATIARQRNTSAAALVKILSGDLQSIVGRALYSDREKRYSSAERLAEDLQRYLDREPVHARLPWTTSYKVTRFVQRRSALVMSMLLLAAITLGFTGTLIAQRTAMIQARDAAEEARVAARNEAAVKSEVVRFLQDMFAESDPAQSRGQPPNAKELLARGARKIEDSAAPAAVRAELMKTIGSAYMSLGAYPEAKPLLDQAHSLHTQESGEDHPNALLALRERARLAYREGQFSTAESLYAKVRLGLGTSLGSEDVESLITSGDLALTLIEQSKYEPAEKLLLQTIAAQTRVLGQHHNDTLLNQENLGLLYWEQSRYGEAEPIFEKISIAFDTKLGEDHPDSLIAANNLATLYRTREKYVQAEAQYRKTLAIQERVLTRRHPDTLITLNNLADLLTRQERYREAEPLLTELLAVRREVLGESHASTLTSINNLAFFKSARGEYSEAERLFIEALRKSRELLGDDHPDTTSTMGNLGDVYVKLDRLEEAEELLRQALDLETRQLGREHFYTAITTRKYGAVLIHLRRFDEARMLLTEAHQNLVATVGEDHAQTQKAVRNLITLHDATGAVDQSNRWRDQLTEQADSP